MEYKEHIATKKGFKNYSDYLNYSKKPLNDKRKMLRKMRNTTAYEEHLKWINKKGFNSYNEYQDHLSKKKGFRNRYEYEQYLAKKQGFTSTMQRYNAKLNGFDNIKDYKNFLARKKGFIDDKDYKKYLNNSTYGRLKIRIKKKGFKSIGEYENHCAKKRGFKNKSESKKNRIKKRGFTSLDYTNYSARKHGFLNNAHYQRFLKLRKKFNNILSKDSLIEISKKHKYITHYKNYQDILNSYSQKSVRSEDKLSKINVSSFPQGENDIGGVEIISTPFIFKSDNIRYNLTKEAKIV